MQSSDGAGWRWLAAPLQSLTVPRTQSQQTDAYLENARLLAQRVCEQALDKSGVPRERIGLIIGISCTGVSLPSLDAELIPILGLPLSVARLPITELGCGGGLAGLARGLDYLRAYPERAVLLFAVELPSLTFQPNDHSIDNLVAAMVFGDGAGAMVLQSGSHQGWTVQECVTSLLPEGAGQLGFELRDGGLRVVLSRDLPRVVSAKLRAPVEQFLESQRLTLADVDVIAAHPGGPRIFDAIQRALEVGPEALAISRQVFEHYGNASSAGIFFVLQALQSAGVKGCVLAIAFGPGLSIELSLLRFCP
jgi:alkylresorcinol/alkylpyrone synthase